MSRSRPALIRLTWDTFDAEVDMMVGRIHAHLNPHKHCPGVYGEPRGGLTLAVVLSHRLRLPFLQEPEDGMVWCDDIVDSGHTLRQIQSQYQEVIPVALVWNRAPFCTAPLAIGGFLKQPASAWYVFPWEDAHAVAADFEQHHRKRNAK